MKSSAAVDTKDAATQEGVQAIDATPTEPSSARTRDAETVVDAATIHQESVETGNDENDVDIIWHNMYAPSDFTTWRKTSRRSIHELLVDFTALVQQGYLEVINLSVSKSSFVAIIGCEKNWADMQDKILEATR